MRYRKTLLSNVDNISWIFFQDVELDLLDCVASELKEVTSTEQAMLELSSLLSN